MYALGVSAGDEVICPSVTYWSSCCGALQLDATVVFCDIEPKVLQLSPESFEAHITPRTKLLVVVHYMACPADMDRSMAIARRHGVKVLEDVSHAQGGHYMGRMLVWCVLNSVRVSQAFLRQFGANATKHSDYVWKHLRQNAQKGRENVMNL